MTKAAETGAGRSPQPAAGAGGDGNSTGATQPGGVNESGEAAVEGEGERVIESLLEVPARARSHNERLLDEILFDR